MSTLTLRQKPLFLSTFLSHSSTDYALVEKVAKRLGRRGILPWLDRNELAMGSLDAALKQAVQQQTTITIFLSKASLASSWCMDELRWAIESEKGCGHLLPVYLVDPLKLVRAHSWLRTRFLHPDGDRVNQKGFFHADDPVNPDPDAVAEEIAQTIYRRSILEEWAEIAIALDQRGNGQRRGLPTLPTNLSNLQAPTLTFRPNSGLRQPKELLTGKDWEDMVQTMTRALSTALGTVRGDIRKVRVFGEAQAGLMWAVGRYFNRTTSADLYSYGRDGMAITNAGQMRHTPLAGGDPNCAKLLSDMPSNSSGKQSKIALGIGSAERYSKAVQKSVPKIPLFWIDSGFISDSAQAMSLVANIVASVEHLRQIYEVRELVLFWTTANHVALLAAANLTSHVIPKIKFMEWDHAHAKYAHLPMSNIF